jgi:2-amino-4-hydroxy-6-hydroxymethyldihydropteridine diphosphokinase
VSERPLPLPPSSPQPALAAIALGANLAWRGRPPRDTLLAALDRIALLPLTQLIRVSALRATLPQGPGTEGQPAYVNGCAALRTLLPPRGLLVMLLQIERDFGRVRDAESRNAARTLDLDVLTHADAQLHDASPPPELILPHPRLHERRFVLEPLAEVLPDTIIPGHHATARELLSRLPASPNP